MVSRYLDWLREAEDDLSAAIALKKLGKFSKACFFAQQAAEKSLKALIMKRAGKYEPTHSIYQLLKKTEEYGIKVDENLRRAGKKLDRFYVMTRYPNVWPEGAPFEYYDEKDAEEAIELAKNIFDFVRRSVEEAV